MGLGVGDGVGLGVGSRVGDSVALGDGVGVSDGGVVAEALALADASADALDPSVVDGAAASPHSSRESPSAVMNASIALAATWTSPIADVTVAGSPDSTAARRFGRTGSGRVERGLERGLDDGADVVGCGVERILSLGAGCLETVDRVEGSCVLGRSRLRKGTEIRASSSFRSAWISTP